MGVEMQIGCREDLNVAVAFKAMGVESDQEMMQIIGPEPAFLPLLMPTLQECKQLGIHTQQQALDYIGAKLAIGLCLYLHLKLESRSVSLYLCAEEDSILLMLALCRLLLRSQVSLDVQMTRHCLDVMTAFPCDQITVA